MTSFDYMPVATREVLASFAGPLTVWVGDTLPDQQFQLLYEDGGYLDLNPGGVICQVTCYIARYKGTKKVTSGLCIVTDPLHGIVTFQSSYVWRVPGLYEGQCRIRFGTDPPGFDWLSSQKFLIHCRMATPIT